MSLLQRLSERAQTNLDPAHQANTLELRKRRFNEITVPLLKELETFLRNLGRQLKSVSPDVRQRYEIPGYGQIESVPVFDWVITSDAKLTEFSLELRWRSRVDTDRAPKVALNTPDRVRAVSEVLKRMVLGGIRDEKRGPSGTIMAANVQVTGFINSKISVKSVLDNDDNDDIVFNFENVDQMGTMRRVMPVRLVGPDVFNRLGEFIIRENDLFVREHWVRGLQPIVRELTSAPVQAQEERPKYANMIADLTPRDFTPPPPTEAEIAKTKAMEEQARERELDFLAELKMAARYADSAVKKLGDSGESGEFGSERDMASLRASFSKQIQKVPEPSSSSNVLMTDATNAKEAATRVAESALPITKPVPIVEPQPAPVVAAAEAMPPPRSQEFLTRFQNLKAGLEKIKKD
jgi:hypothetical protein